MEVSRTPQFLTVRRLAVMFACIVGIAWTCHGAYAGHRVSQYTFEEALRLVQQGSTNPRIACAQLRERIIEAIHVLRKAGDDGAIAVEAIHQESRR